MELNNGHTYAQMSSFEIWAGVECTVNRVMNHYMDQIENTEHTLRETDIKSFFELGITKLRVPILWERVMPTSPENARWGWTDSVIHQLRQYGITPIIGLLHHGSGPIHTSLLDHDFGPKFAKFAQAVAKRYPHVTEYILVNEPVTTARFSMLYGHWYPHLRDNKAFCYAVINQCKAVVLGMEAIREVNGTARFIQTDDLGNIFSSPHFSEQAAFEEERRWVGFDLLLRQLIATNIMWHFFLQNDIKESQLYWFHENNGQPDVIGVNYYTTSERFLDDNYSLYPAHLRGRNKWGAYADTEAVRVPQGIAGPYILLERLWQRYHVPIAITEVQNASTRDEQIRWLAEIFDVTQRLRQKGVDICALTIWNLLGSYDWNNLMTSRQGIYEVGAFDIRGPELRPTAIAHIAQEIIAGRVPTHPLLAIPGWWHRSARVSYPDAQLDLTSPLKDLILNEPPSYTRNVAPRPVLLLGSLGSLDKAFIHLFQLRGIPYENASLEHTSPEHMQHSLELINPWAIICSLEEPEQDKISSFMNQLAPFMAGKKIQFLLFSSDRVFYSVTPHVFVETSATNPMDNFGESQVLLENHMLSTVSQVLLVRTGPIFSHVDPQNFLTKALSRSLQGMYSLATNNDVQYGLTSPSYDIDVVNNSLDLLIDGETGIWHLANSGAMSTAEVLSKAYSQMYDQSITEEHSENLLINDSSYKPAPYYRILNSNRSGIMACIEDALSRCVIAYRRMES